MSIRDIQLTHLSEMDVSINVARFLASARKQNMSHIMRCRLEILMGIQYGCKQLSEWRGYSIDCYGNDVNKNIDFLSDHCPDMKMLTHFYNAAHPECDFARLLIVNKEFDSAYELLDNYIEWLTAFYEQLLEEGTIRLAKKNLKDLLEHILTNLGERVSIVDVESRLPDDFHSMSPEAQQECVQRICRVL